MIGPTQLKSLGIHPKQVSSKTFHISAAGGSRIKVVGMFNAKLTLGGRITNQKMLFSKYVDRFFLSRQTCVALGIVPPSFPHPPTDSIESKFPYPPMDYNKSQPHSLGGISTNGSGRGQAIVRHFNRLSRSMSIIPNVNGVHIHGTNSQVWRRIVPQIHMGQRTESGYGN